MAERIYSYGKSPSNVTYTVRVYDADYVGDSAFVEAAKGGINIKWDATGSDDRYSPILGSTAELAMLVPVGDTDITSFLDDLRTSTEGRFTMEISSDGSYAVAWVGIVIADNSGESDTAVHFEAKIRAVDGLSLLKDKPYSYVFGTPRKRFTQIITRCLTEIPHYTYWEAGDVLFETSVDWWSTVMTASGSADPLHLSTVNQLVFQTPNTTAATDDDVMSCFEVLEAILTCFGCRMYQLGGMFRVEQIDYRAASSYDYRRYDRDGAFLSYAARSGINTINQTEFGAKISYVDFDYLPQINKAVVRYQVKERRNYWAGLTFDETSSPFISDQNISSGTGDKVFRLQGVINYNLTAIPSAVGSGQIMQAEIRLILKIGTNILERTATYSNFSAHYGDTTWVTSTSTAYLIATDSIVLPQPNETAIRIIPFDFVTPPLPSDGDDVYVFVQHVRLVKSDGTTLITGAGNFTPTFTVEDMRMAAYDLGIDDIFADEVIYEAVNPDESSLKWERKTLFGSYNGVNEAGKIMSYNAGGTLEWSVLWGAGVDTRDNYLGQLLADTVLHGQIRPIKRMNGTIFGTFDPMKLMRTDDGIDWLLQRGEWSLADNEIRGSWIEMDYGTGAVPSTPVKIKVLVGPTTPTVNGPIITAPTGNGNQGFATNSPATILAPVAFNFLGTEIGEGDTVTSIDLVTASEGNEFLAGDGVTIVHPVSGRFQTFTIDTPPALGDTFLDVVSEVADFTMPESASLVVKQKAFSFRLPSATQGQILRYNDTTDKWEAYSGTTDGHVLTWDTTNGWQSEALPGGSGTVTNVSSGDFSPIFTVAISNPTTTPAFAFSAIVQAANLIFAGPTTGASAAPTFRALVLADLANNLITYAKLQQGTALSVLGVTGNATANLADIAAGADGYVLRRSGTALAFGTVATAGIADDAVTLAKLQNAVANNIVLGNVAGAGQPYVELTVAQLQTLLAFIDGTGTANRFAFFTDTNTLSTDAAFTLDATNDRMTITGTVAGSGANNAFLNLNSGAISGTTEFLRMSGNIAGNMIGVMSNANVAAGTSNTIFQIASGGAAGGDPILQFTIAGVVTHAIGPDNSDSDKIKITPGSSTPGGTANKGLIITNDAASLVGINKDAPVYPLDVDGRARATQNIGLGGQWATGNVTVGGGAGTGATVNSAIGPCNCVTITFTTGTAPTLNGTIFTATYPLTFPGGAVPTFSARSGTAATDIAKFYLSANNANAFTLQANGTLLASTQYILTFVIFGW